MYGLSCVFLCFIIYLQVQCKNHDQSKNPLPYFRRQVEEIDNDTTTQSSLSGSEHSNLVSFLIKNVKKIYNELDDIEQPELSGKDVSSANSILTSHETTSGLGESTSEQNVTNKDIVQGLINTFKARTNPPPKNVSSTKLMNYLHEIAVYKNTTLANVTDKKSVDMESSTIGSELAENEELMHLSKNLIVFETDRRERDNINYFAHNASYFPSGTDISIRSCIFCNNIALSICSDPKNRLVTSTVCDRDDDVCYSLHTPFGVVDRGCFNVNHNLTTYVCSCNLCNYISISEMPYIFSTHQEWVENMIELSRTKHLRKSVYKDISCLKCESNATAKTGDMLDTANCLEGNIGSLPVEECDEDEICAVKAIKHDGYLWRGCVKQPLYNYWWGFCDSDLCNYETVKSIFNSE